LLEQGGDFDAHSVVDRFMRESSGSLPPIIRQFVLQKLAEYAQANGSGRVDSPISVPGAQ